MVAVILFAGCSSSVPTKEPEVINKWPGFPREESRIYETTYHQIVKIVADNKYGYYNISHISDNELKQVNSFNVRQNECTIYLSQQDSLKPELNEYKLYYWRYYKDRTFKNGNPYQELLKITWEREREIKIIYKLYLHSLDEIK
jgi:hypothetical protein